MLGCGSYAHLDEDKNSICERKNSIALQGWKPVRSFFWSFLSLTITHGIQSNFQKDDAIEGFQSP